MSFEEKGVWVLGIVAIAAYAVYLAIVLGAAGGGPLTEVAYQWPMIFTIGGAIVAGILVTIVVAIASPKDADRKDQRDRDIYRWGEYVGHSFVIAGALVALGLALLDAHTFWIANTIYLAFVLSGILATVTKLLAYRRGLPTW
jgi:hypothetical protein